MLSLRKGLADLCFTPVSHVLKWMLPLFNIEKSCFHCWVSEFGTVPCEVFSSVGWLSLTTALCAASLSRSWPRFLEGLPCSCICVSAGMFYYLVCSIAENETGETGMKSKSGDVHWEWALWTNSLRADFSGWVGSTQSLEMGYGWILGRGRTQTKVEDEKVPDRTVSNPTLVLCSGRKAVCWRDPILGSLLLRYR